MESSLTELRCTACHAGAPRVTDEEREVLSAQIPEWEIVEVEGVPRLQRAFTFSDWRSTIAFVDRVGDLAEAEDHHPELLVRYGRVRVRWWTHAIRWLHRNDFIMAAKSDEVYAGG